MMLCREKLLRRLDTLKGMRHSNIMQFYDYWVLETEPKEGGSRKIQINYITEVITSGMLGG